jgi:hypothetical protein
MVSNDGGPEAINQLKKHDASKTNQNRTTYGEKTTHTEEYWSVMMGPEAINQLK